MDEINKINLNEFIRGPIDGDDYYDLDRDLAISICFCLTGYAKKYIHSKQATFLNIKPKLRNAILIDAINYIGEKNHFEFGLNTEYLVSKEKDDEIIQPELLLTVILNEFTSYLANENIEESVVEHRAYTDYKFGFDNEEAENILFDFIRYIARKNYYDIDNELTKMKENINSRKYLYQDKIGAYQGRLKTETLESIYNKEVEAMIIAFLNNEGNPDMIEDSFLKAKVLAYKGKTKK